MMEKSSCVLAILSAVFIPLAFSDNCMPYVDQYKKWHSEEDCGFTQFCCGDCERRYCCRNYFSKFEEDAQMNCHRRPNDAPDLQENFDNVNSRPNDAPDLQENFDNVNSMATPIVSVVVTIVIVVIVIIISCCTCSCCCLYRMRRGSPRSVIAPNATTTTTVRQVPYQQQPTATQTYPSAQYPAYQQVPVQECPSVYPPQVSGAPPPYHEAVSVGMEARPYPPAQLGYNPNQPNCNLSGAVYNPDQPAYNPAQPAYNPAYMDPHKPGH
ncbi:protein shisa-5-like isoform X2 [Acipenser ruthenus]|uniref:protein shisa-5-like isoform X2 n=1 Tax=Acipenser ruthenus TaxID=7906 RepID=UPI002740590E|nr:protein shisa-5-like isoform X2 [Acipenser ruthenus]